MKDKIEQAAKEYAGIDKQTDFYYNAYNGFVVGAEWMQDQYKGLTPETVEQIVSVLKDLYNESAHVMKHGSGNISASYVLGTVNNILNIVSKELKP